AEAAVISHPIVDASSEQGRRLFEVGVNLFWSPFEHPGTSWFRPKVIEGRLPDPSRTDEVAIAYKAGSRVHLGDRIVLRIEKAGAHRDRFPTADTLPGAFPVRVVGVVLPVTSLDLTAPTGVLFATPAF